MENLSYSLPPWSISDHEINNVCAIRKKKLPGEDDEEREEAETSSEAPATSFHSSKLLFIVSRTILTCHHESLVCFKLVNKMNSEMMKIFGSAKIHKFMPHFGAFCG